MGIWPVSRSTQWESVPFLTPRSCFRKPRWRTCARVVTEESFPYITLWGLKAHIMVSCFNVLTLPMISWLYRFNKLVCGQCKTGLSITTLQSIVDQTIIRSTTRLHSIRCSQNEANCSHETKSRSHSRPSEHSQLLMHNKWNAKPLL
jgi:hypothetical protein